MVLEGRKGTDAGAVPARDRVSKWGYGSFGASPLTYFSSGKSEVEIGG